MLTRQCAARAAALPENALPPLPLNIVCVIVLRLPPDQRLLLALVSRPWRAVVDDASLWSEINVSPSSGVCRASDALLRALSAKARSLMVSLDVSGLLGYQTGVVSRRAAFEVLRYNSRSLRHVDVRCGDEPLHEWHTLPLGYVAELREAAPHASFFVDVSCDPSSEVAELFSGATRLGCASDQLVVRRLCVEPVYGDRDTHWTHEALCISRLSSMLAATHPPIREVVIYHAPVDVPGALAALAATVQASRISCLRIYQCNLGNSFDDLLPALSGGCLTSFGLFGGQVNFRTLSFPAALRTCILTRLFLSDVGLWNDISIGVAVVQAVTNHASLVYANLSRNIAGVQQQQELGPALAALVAANASALTSLNMSACNLRDGGMTQVVEALRVNTHLTFVRISGNNPGPGFGALLRRCLESNTTLRELYANTNDHEDWREINLLEAAVARRSGPGVHV